MRPITSAEMYGVEPWSVTAKLGNALQCYICILYSALPRCLRTFLPCSNNTYAALGCVQMTARTRNSRCALQRTQMHSMAWQSTGLQKNLKISRKKNQLNLTACVRLPRSHTKLSTAAYHDGSDVRMYLYLLSHFPAHHYPSLTLVFCE